MERAIFAAGCFWGIEKAFAETDGVEDTRVGYTGGSKDKPTYEQVCSGKTGHAEAVEVKYDPKKISYEELLEIFWKIHDPTQLNKQGPDVGTQYRSAIFYTSEEQKKKAEKSRDKQQKELDRDIVTEISPAEKFWEAEKYHQKFYRKNKVMNCFI